MPAGLPFDGGPPLPGGLPFEAAPPFDGGPPFPGGLPFDGGFRSRGPDGDVMGCILADRGCSAAGRVTGVQCGSLDRLLVATTGREECHTAQDRQYAADESLGAIGIDERHAVHLPNLIGLRHRDAVLIRHVL